MATKKKTHLRTHKPQPSSKSSSSSGTSIANNAPARIQASMISNPRVPLEKRQQLAVQYSQHYGNQNLQRAIQREEDGPDPDAPVLNPEFMGFLGDLQSTLDLGFGLADLVIGETALMGTTGATIAGGLIGIAGAGFMVYSFVQALSNAMNAGNKLAAVMGSSYSVMSIIHGQDTPEPPDYFKNKQVLAWYGADDKMRDKMKKIISEGGKPMIGLLNYLYFISKQDPSSNLNSIFQTLVDQNLKEFGFTFGGVFEGLGWEGIESNPPVYHIAKQLTLSWPNPR